MPAAPRNVKNNEPARSYDDYVSDWITVSNTAQWAKGDLIAAMVKETFYGEGTMTKFAESVDEAESTLYTYKQVAEAYPEDSRRREIPWSVYKEFVREDDRLALVKDFAGTVRQAREMLAQRKADSAPVVPPPAAITVPEPVAAPETPEPAPAVPVTAEYKADHRTIKVIPYPGLTVMEIISDTGRVTARIDFNARNWDKFIRAEYARLDNGEQVPKAA